MRRVDWWLTGVVFVVTAGLGAEPSALETTIERLESADPEREEKVQQVFALIRQDIRDEEDLLLPQLQDTMDAAQLRRLGAGWEAVRRTAPTHPHPVVPRRPPGNAADYWKLKSKPPLRPTAARRPTSTGRKTCRSTDCNSGWPTTSI